MSVRLHIRRLVLDGVDVSRRHQPALKAAVETELGRLVRIGRLDKGLLSTGARPAARGGAMEVPAAGDPARLGRRIARAVYRGIGR